MELRECPRCGSSFVGRGALSREDPTVEVCPPCGTDEAVQTFARSLIPQTLTDLVKQIDALCEATGWDASPMIHVAAYTESGWFENAVILVSDVHPATALEVIGPVPGEALAVSMESYAYPPRIQKTIRSEADAQRAGLPSDYPDRVEQRLVLAVSRIGEEVALLRTRGAPEPEVFTRGGITFAGRVFDALKGALR